MFDNIKNKLFIHFPKLQIKFKNQSLSMKLINKLLFFNKSFMTNFTTTIGNTVYFPSEQFVKTRQISSFIILIHELVHISDSYKYSFPIFAFLYLFPQSIILLSLLLFLFNWKIALCLIILCSLPIPAYFRMNFEKRAYLVSLYVMNKLNKKYRYNISLSRQKDLFLDNFKDSSYYFMWPFKSLNRYFDVGLDKINNNQRPFEDDIFDKIDSLIESF